MAQAGTAYVTVLPDTASFAGQLDGLLGGMAGKIEGKFGTLGKAATVGLGAVVVGAGLAGKALYDIGEQFDSAYDTIRVGTGATGRELEGLKADFKDVVSSVPTDFDSAGQAITQLNQRLGITGDPLRKMSKQVLELSRITGTDLDGNIQSVTRTLGDWGVKVNQQPKFLDKMFRASQETGISVQDLGEQMVRYGAPLRQMGFGFSEAAAMVGKFEKEGVNAQLVMGSLRIALGKMATEGVEDPSKALEILTQNIKNAGSAGEANKLAIETFGARAGPDMAAAIREGRFEYGDLVKQIDGGKETIMGAGRDTMDFGEKWTLLKNRVFVALEPIATRVFNAIGDGMTALTDLMSGKGNIHGALQSVIDDLRPFFPIVEFMFDRIKGVITGLATAWMGAFDMIRGVVLVFSGLLRGDFSKMWDGVKTIFTGAFGLLKGMFMALPGQLLVLAWNAGKAIFHGLTDLVKAAPGAIWAAVSEIPGKLIGAYVSISVSAVQLGLAIWGGIIDWVKGIPGKVWDFISTVGPKIVSAYTGIVSAAVDIGKGIWHGVIDWVRDIPGKVWDFVSGIPAKILGVLQGVFSAAQKVGGNIVDGIVGAVKTLPELIKQALTSIPDVVADIGRAIADWLNENTPLGDNIHIDLPGPKNLDFKLPALASGTNFFEGGLALVGEQGPELAALPRGTAVYNARQTRSMLSMRSGVGGSFAGTSGGGEFQGDLYVGEELLWRGVRGVVREREDEAALAHSAGIAP